MEDFGNEQISEKENLVRAPGIVKYKQIEKGKNEVNDEGGQSEIGRKDNKISPGIQKMKEIFEGKEKEIVEKVSKVTDLRNAFEVLLEKKGKRETDRRKVKRKKQIENDGTKQSLIWGHLEKNNKKGLSRLNRECESVEMKEKEKSNVRQSNPIETSDPKVQPMVQSLAISFEGTPNRKSQEGQKMSQKRKIIIKPSTRSIKMSLEDVKVVPESKINENNFPGGQILKEENLGKIRTFKEEFTVTKSGVKMEKWGESEIGANGRKEETKIEKSIENKIRTKV